MGILRELSRARSGRVVLILLAVVLLGLLGVQGCTPSSADQEGNRYNWIFVLDTVGEVTATYLVTAIPTSFFIDSEGIIRGVNIGAMTKPAMEAELAKAMSGTADDNGSKLEPAPEVGRLAPDFTLADLDGNQVSLSDFRGEAVFLNFWATWCPPCRAEMPEIEAIYQEYKNKDVVVIGVDIKETREEVLQFIQ